MSNLVKRMVNKLEEKINDESKNPHLEDDIMLKLVRRTTYVLSGIAAGMIVYRIIEYFHN